MQKTVLIVEDEFLIAMDLIQMLQALGWQVIGPAASVKAALQLLDHESPAVALLDVNLGTEVVTLVAEVLKARNVPFAVASAYDEPEKVGGAVLAGVPNAGKPTSERQLMAVMAQLTAL